MVDASHVEASQWNASSTKKLLDLNIEQLTREYKALRKRLREDILPMPEKEIMWLKSSPKTVGGVILIFFFVKFVEFKEKRPIPSAWLLSSKKGTGENRKNE